MKITRRIGMLAFLLSVPQLALAQSSGSVTLTGTIPEAFSLTDVSNTNLSSTITLGTLIPGTGGAPSQGTVTVRVRSNKAYKLLAQATSLSFSSPGADDGGVSLASSDIGFGVTGLDATGANVANSATRTDTLVGKYNYTGSGFNGFPSSSNGLTPFLAGTHGTLNDIDDGLAVQLLSGPRISSRGDRSTSDNFLLVSFGVGVLPQYFTPNSQFSTTVTVTIQSQ